MLRRILLGAVLALAPTAVFPHPHLFVDAGVTLRFDDQGRLGAVGVVWVYDEHSTQLILDDLGLDVDGDGMLSGDDMDRLRDAAGDWPQDFEGDLDVTRNGSALDLSGPLELMIDYRDSRLIETHLRAVIGRPDPAEAPILLRIFDPVHYTAYSLTASPRILGRDDCQVTVDRVDQSAALEFHARELAKLDMINENGEVPAPELGHAFADTVTLHCTP